MTYPTLAEIKRYLQIELSIEGDDDLFADLLADAKKFIEGPAGAGRAFEATVDSTRTFDAVADVSGRTLYLDKDLCSITSITNGDGQVIPSTAYVTEPRSEAPYFAIKLKASQAYVWTFVTDPENAISIVGKWGYSTAAPDDIAQKCTRLVAFLYRQKGTNADVDRPLITGDGVTILPSAVPSDVMAVLKAYRRKSL